MKKKIITYSLYSLLTISVTVQAAPSAAVLTFDNQITGVAGDVLRNVIERLKQEENQYSPLNASEIHHLYQQSSKAIEEAVQPFGYFKARIHGKLDHHGNSWIAHHEVDLGPALKIKNIQISIKGEGTNNTKIQKLIGQFPLHQEDIFATKSYSQAKQFLIDHLVEESYLNAQFQKSQVNVDLLHYQANVVLDINTGPRYFFGETIFSQNPFNPEFLKRFINYKIGEPYNASKLKELQQNFNSNSSFKEVEIVPDLNLESSTRTKVPIHINLKPTKNKEYLVGLGYGTDTGARGQLSFKFPYFGHNGEQIKGLLKASTGYSKLLASYIIPGQDPVKSHYTMSASVERQNQNIGKSTTAALTSSYTTQFKNGWEQTLSLNLMNDRSTIADKNVIASNLLFYPSINWLKLKVDNALNPNNGYRVVVNLLGAPKTMLSSIRFLQAQLTAKSVHRLSDKNRLVLHTAIGHTEVSNINRLPLLLRFYSGGAQSIRGFSYRGIGPGRQLLEASAEIQHKVYKSGYIGMFFDAGNVDDYVIPHLKRSVGLNFLWLSSVGAIQLSFAKVLDLPNKPLRIQFNIGPDL